MDLSEATSVTAATALDSGPPVIGPATSGKRKRQRKGQPNEKGKGKKSAAPNDKVVITRTLRSNKKNVAGTKNADSQAQSTQAQTTSVKTESLGTSFTLRYTPSPVPMSAGVNLVDPQVPSNRVMDSEVHHDAKSSNPTDTAVALALPNISKATQLLNIAPPQRSPIPTMNTTIYRRTDLNSRSTLSASHFDGIQAPSPGNISAERDHGLQGSSNHPSKSQRSTPYQQGPIFHTQFQNIGPWNYIASGTTIESVSNVQAPDIPAAPGYIYDAGPVFLPSVDGLPASVYSQGLVAGQYHDLRPLAPTFDWENYIPSSPMEFMYPPDESISMDDIPQIRGEGHPEVMSIHAPFASQTLMAIVADTAH